jgi:hypothetical protein
MAAVAISYPHCRNSTKLTPRPLKIKLPKLFCEASTSLISKPEKQIPQPRKHYRPIFLVRQAKKKNP